MPWSHGAQDAAPASGVCDTRGAAAALTESDQASVMAIEGAGDGRSWWIGGVMYLDGAPLGAAVHLVSRGRRLASAAVGSGGFAPFFDGCPLIPIGWLSLELRVEHPGVAGRARCWTGCGPQPALRALAPAEEPRVEWSVPVRVIAQDWWPRRADGDAEPESNNHLLVMSDGGALLRYERG